MTKRLALIISTSLATAVIAAVAFLMWQAGMFSPPNGGEALAEGTMAAPQATPTASSDVDQLRAANAALLQREQIYQQRLAEANRLLQATVQQPNGQQAAAPQAATLPGTAQLATDPPPPTPGSGGMLSRQDAVEIALAYTGGGRVREVEMESRGGVTAYEVKVDRRKVLVDAYTGEVIVPSSSHHEEEEDDD